MMNVHYKITILSVSILLVLAIIIGQGTANADQKKMVISAVETARRQGISEEIISNILAYSLDGKNNKSHSIHLLSILIRVSEAGIPLNPFDDKINEGFGKQIQPEKIEKSLNKLFDNYVFVRDMLDKAYNNSWVYSEKDILALVESMDYGLPRNELRLLFEWAPAISPEMLSTAAINKALLRQISIDDKLIDSIIYTGLSNQSLTPRWLLFFKVVVAAEKKGISSTKIANAAKDVLTQKGDVGKILEKLGFTSRDVRHGPHIDSPPSANGHSP